MTCMKRLTCRSAWVWAEAAEGPGMNRRNKQPVPVVDLSVIQNIGSFETI